MCGASGGHTHPLIGNALSFTYGGLNHITHVVVTLLTWEFGCLVICGCRRDVGANVSMLNSYRRGRRGWPLLDLLVTVLVWEAHMMWHLVARLHDRREFPMLSHLP